ncbi:MAG: hypothetical protein ACNA7K_06135 [Acholeplasmataceae bacterium]
MRCLHDLLSGYTITSQFTRFAFDLHDLLSSYTITSEITYPNEVLNS